MNQQKDSSSSKKRTFEDFSSKDNYEDINSVYKDLYLERIKNKNKNKKENENENLEEKKIEENLIDKKIMENIYVKSEFYINKLVNYPKNEYQPYMVSFRDMLYEDLLGINFVYF